MFGALGGGDSIASRRCGSVIGLGGQRVVCGGLQPCPEGEGDEGAEGVHSHHGRAAEGVLSYAREREGAGGVRQAPAGDTETASSGSSLSSPAAASA